MTRNIIPALHRLWLRVQEPLVGRSTSGGSVTIGVGYTLFIATSWKV